MPEFTRIDIVFRMAAIAKIRNLLRRKPLTEGELRRREEESLAADQMLDTAVEVRRPSLQLRDPEDDTYSRDLAP